MIQNSVTFPKDRVAIKPIRYKYLYLFLRKFNIQKAQSDFEVGP